MLSRESVELDEIKEWIEYSDECWELVRGFAGMSN
jgi:hypothetical protein